jgi:hypothetical protein
MKLPIELMVIYIELMHHNIMENNKEHYMTCLGDLSMHDK